MLGPYSVLAHIRASKSPKPGNQLVFDNDQRAEMLSRVDDLFELKFAEPVLDVLDQIGHMPLPPYIDRSDTDEDRSRYQTVYGDKLGAVAAPTAGLHFDKQLLNDITAKGASTFIFSARSASGSPIDIQTSVYKTEAPVAPTFAS